MTHSFVLFVLLIRFLFCTGKNSSLDPSNCSLSFTVQTIYPPNTIPTNFPIELIADYNLTCRIPNLIAYYQITPLASLVIDQYQNEDENIESMIKLTSKTFHFNISQSSTIRLCVSSDDDHDDVICRQIHIGINNLYNFWTLPMKIVYIFLICSIGGYHVLYFLRGKWRKIGTKPKSKSRVVQPSPIHRNTRDTFENEKVNETDTSDEDDEE